MILNGRTIGSMCHVFVHQFDSIVKSLKTPVIVSFGNKEIITTAIWDTGSTCTVISPNVIAQLGIKIDGATRINTVSTEDERVYRYTHTINICLPGNIVFQNLRVVGSAIGDGDADVLIGMDIIRYGNLNISNSQERTTLTFSCPS